MKKLAILALLLLAACKTGQPAAAQTPPAPPPPSAFSGPAQTVDSALVTVASFSLTTAGGRVLVLASHTPIAWFNPAITGWRTVIYRDGVKVYADLGAGYFSGDAYAGGGNRVQAVPHVVEFVDAPPAGTHAYTLQVASDGTGGSNPAAPGDLSIENAFLFAMEAKP